MNASVHQMIRTWQSSEVLLIIILECRVCIPQRRAESPIRIQPRAAPWVKMFQLTCALKEQKEGRTSISLAPFALTARQLVNELKPRVIPWAVFLLGLRPVIARNRGSCNARYFLCSLGVLSATIEFHAFSRHVRVVPCPSVATIKKSVA